MLRCTLIITCMYISSQKKSYFFTDLMIEIMEIDVCDPRLDALIEVKANQHINLFWIPDVNEIIDHKKVPLKNACCTAANNRSFLIIWLISSFSLMNAKHPIADTIPKIPLHWRPILILVTPVKSGVSSGAFILILRHPL